MKYYINLLDSLKRGDIAPVYLFYGEEDYLREQAVLQFRQNLLQPETADFNFDILDGEEITAADIVALAETMPFMAERRVLVVRNPRFFMSGKKAGTTGGEQDNEEPAPRGDESLLINYFTRPLKSTCLIFNSKDPVDRRKKIYKTLVKTGQAVDFARLKPAEISRWLAKQARLNGKSLDSGAAEELISRAGNSLSVLLNEIQKVILYSGERKQITVEDIKQVTVPQLEESIFSVLDALAERRCARALQGIRDLLVAKQPPQVILAMIGRQFRLILQAKELLATGYPEGEAAKSLGIHPFAARKIISQCRHFEHGQVVNVLEHLLELDVQVKRGQWEFYPAVEMLLLEISRGE